MADFTGISKDDHERLKEAAVMYRNLTGKDVAGIVARIPVAADTLDQTAQNAKAQAELDRQAEVTRKIEEARQEAREAMLPKTDEQREQEARDKASAKDNEGRDEKARRAS